MRRNNAKDLKCAEAFGSDKAINRSSACWQDTTPGKHRFTCRLRSSIAIAITGFLFSSVELFGQVGGSAAGPGAGDPRNSAAQRNGAVSTRDVPQVEPLSPYLIRPERVIEHPAPIQPPQPEYVPAIEPQSVQDVAPTMRGTSYGFMPNTPGLSQSFQGISATGWIPPDPIIAAGPNHVVVATNSSFAIYTKTGLRQYLTTFGAWFSTLNPPSAIFDPKVVYDPNAGRWILLVLAKDDTAQRSYYLISVSENSDPNGRWWSWLLDAGLNGGTASGLWADFEGLGYDSSEAVYITSNQYGFNNAYFYSKIRILYKSQLYWVGTAGSIGWYDLWNLLDADGTTVFTLKPAQADSPLSGEYFINTRSGGGSAVTLWRLTNPLSTPTLVRQATIPIGTYFAPFDAVQLAGADLIDVGDCRTQEVGYQNGKLVTAFTEGKNWGSGNVSALRTLVIDAASNAVDFNTSFGGDGLWYYYPAIVRDNTGNLALVFNRSSGSEYANTRYTVKLVADSSWEGSAGLKTGEANYSVITNGRNRWGDYSGAALDPADATKAWVYSEYALPGNQWSTWIGQIPLGSTQFFTITTSSNPSNGGTTSGGGSFASGASVTVTATPNSGYNFSNWTEGGSVVSTAASYTFTVNSNRALVANFTARPPNDDFASAQIISGNSGSAPGSNVNATKQTGEPLHAGNSGGTSIWYSWIAPASGQVTFDTFQSAFDTLLGVYTGNTVASLNLIASNDDAPTGGLQSRVTFNASAGVTYKIAIDGYSGASGATALHWLLNQQTYTIAVSASPSNGGTVSGGGTFNAGTSRTVTAVANSGFSFSNWTENGSVVSTLASYSFTLNSNRTLVANFTATSVSYTIVTNSSPANGGTTSGGGTYASGSSVTVSASANNSFTFSNWTESGNVVSTSANYTFTATSNRTLTANFAAKQYSILLSVSPPGSGTVIGSGTYTSGANVTVTASANSGYTFSNWTQNGSVVSTSASYTFTAAADRTLVANFTTFYTILTSAAPSNGGTTSGGGSFASGASVTVTATPSSGFNFINWTENGSPVSTAASYTFTVNNNRALVGNFASKPPNNDFAAAQLITGNSGSVSGSNVNATKESGESFHAGNNGGASIWYSWTALTSGPATIDTFQSNFDTLLAVYTGNDINDLNLVVSNDDAPTGGLQSSVTFNADSGVTYLIAIDGYNGATGSTVLHWLLGQPMFTLSVSASPSNGGTVTGGGTFTGGTSRTVTATPNAGFIFTNWTENGSIVSTSASYTFTLNSDRTLVANFIAGAANYTITLSVSPLRKGSVSGGGSFPAGSLRTVSAFPARRFVFSSWTENGITVSTSASYTFTLTGNRSLVANFLRRR